MYIDAGTMLINARFQGFRRHFMEEHIAHPRNHGTGLNMTKAYKQ